MPVADQGGFGTEDMIRPANYPAAAPGMTMLSMAGAAGGGMAQWREKIFAQMHLNASAAAEFLKLPMGSVVELGSKVEI